MKTFLLLLPMLLLGGCGVVSAVQARRAAIQAENEAAQRQIQETQPQCSLPRQCEAMWVAARDWIAESCGYKIQTATDNLLETFNSTEGDVSLGCRATKTPRPEAGYKFEAHAGCANMFGCSVSPLIAIQRFNNELNAVGATFKN